MKDLFLKNLHQIKLFNMLNLNLKKIYICQYTRLYSRPNKCFSCEKDILRNENKYINFVFPVLCFSCERQSKTPYHEGPTKLLKCNRLLFNQN